LSRTANLEVFGKIASGAASLTAAAQTSIDAVEKHARANIQARMNGKRMVIRSANG
jgi:hypothetical protein